MDTAPQTTGITQRTIGGIEIRSTHDRVAARLALSAGPTAPSHVWVSVSIDALVGVRSNVSHEEGIGIALAHGVCVSTDLNDALWPPTNEKEQ